MTSMMIFFERFILVIFEEFTFQNRNIGIAKPKLKINKYAAASRLL